MNKPQQLRQRTLDVRRKPARPGLDGPGQDRLGAAGEGASR